VDRRQYVGEVVVAGDHDRLVGVALERLAVLTAPGEHIVAAPRAAGIVRKADLDTADALGLDLRHRFDRPRPAPVQARSEVVGQDATEAVHYRDLVAFTCVRPVRA